MTIRSSLFRVRRGWKVTVCAPQSDFVAIYVDDILARAVSSSGIASMMSFGTGVSGCNEDMCGDVYKVKTEAVQAWATCGDDRLPFWIRKRWRRSTSSTPPSWAINVSVSSRISLYMRCPVCTKAIGVLAINVARPASYSNVQALRVLQ